MMMPQAPLWRGSRGEWYVVLQVLLIALVFFGPSAWPNWSRWTSPYTWLGSLGGGFLLIMGGVLFLAGIFKLGANLTPFPYPKTQATLIETGPYKIVRHPIYSGGLFVAFGWAFWAHGWLTILYALILFVFLDFKARREEQWLKEKFPSYAAYQKRVHKLIPFVY